MPQAAAESLSALVTEARVRTRSLLEATASHCNVPVPRVQIRFDLRGRTAGQVRLPRRGDPVIRYNLQLLSENGTDFLSRTVPHEVAHVIAPAAFGPHIRPHGPEWQSLMRYLGADPRRCHDYDTSRCAARRLTRHSYHCGCREHALTSIRHKRILAGQTYVCRSCGTALRPGRKPGDASESE